MKWLVINAIALLAAIALFGTSITYAAANITSAQHPPPIYEMQNEPLEDPTLADLMFSSSTVSTDYVPQKPGFFNDLPPADPNPIEPPGKTEVKNSDVGTIKNDSTQNLPSSAPPSATVKPPKSSNMPSSSVGASSEISSNAISSNAISSNAISSNAISSNAISSSEVVSSEISSIAVSDATNDAPLDTPVNVNEDLLRLIAGAVQREIVGVNTPPQAKYYEAYKAQAIACHTYMVYYRKSDGSYPTMSYTEPHPTTLEILRPVVNQLLTYNGAVINAPYHAASGGATQSAQFVWNNAIPYLVGATSAYDDYLSSYTVGANDLAAMFASNSITLSGDPSTWFNLGASTYTDGGFIDYLSVCGQQVKGRVLRENLIGTAKLKSCKITDITYDGANITFQTKGYGHGVGMSQQGALGYSANEGWTYSQILLHYYPGAVLS